MKKNLLKFKVILGTAFLAVLITFTGAQAQQGLMVKGARYTMSIEPPITMRAKGFDYDHQIQVALPATYNAQPEKKIPGLVGHRRTSRVPLDCGHPRRLRHG